MVLECHRCENSFSWECEISWRCQWRLISRGSGRLCGNWWLYTHPNTKACWVEVQGGCCISLSVLFDSLFSFKQLEAAFSYIGSLRCRRPMENNNPACVRNTHTHTHTHTQREFGFSEGCSMETHTLTDPFPPDWSRSWCTGGEYTDLCLNWHVIPLTWLTEWGCYWWCYETSMVVCGYTRFILSFDDALLKSGMSLMFLKELTKADLFDPKYRIKLCTIIII